MAGCWLILGSLDSIYNVLTTYNHINNIITYFRKLAKLLFRHVRLVNKKVTFFVLQTSKRIEKEVYVQKLHVYWILIQMAAEHLMWRKRNLTKHRPAYDSQCLRIMDSPQQVESLTAIEKACIFLTCRTKNLSIVVRLLSSNGLKFQSNLLDMENH